jgi:hypothetical protein
MPYGIKIELSGTDITDKVSRFEITTGMDSYVRELSLEIADPDYFDTFDFSVLPDAPTLQVFTKISTAWVSQGIFHLEKPTYRVGIHMTTTGIWGRSQTARLGSPFAPKVSKVYDSDIMFFDVCDEMCDLAGLTWNPAYSDVPDFLVYGYSYQAENIYPIEVMNGLLELAYGQDAFVSTDRAGNVCIRRIDRAPGAADHTITDSILSEIAEEPEWPDFGNRIKISSAGSISGYGISLTAANGCLQPGGTVKLYARVTNQDGEAVDGAPVSWEVTYNLATLRAAVTNTQTVLIPEEEVRASGYYSVQTKFPPESVTGIWAKKDTGKTQNLIAGGYEIDGNTITVASRFSFCDQLLLIAYTVDGVAVNVATAGNTSGTEKITASVGGSSAEQEIYIDNPCQCPPVIVVKANPSSILVGESARVLTYVELGGAPVTDGRTVYNTIDTIPSHGHIQWTSNSLQRVSVTNEKVTAINEISGLTQCELDMFPASVSAVYRFTEDDEGSISRTGNNLYSSHSGKTVTLNAQVVTGTELVADYVAQGAVVNVFEGLSVGTDTIRGIVHTSREEPSEASCTITVNEEDEDPDDQYNSGLCEAQSTPCDSLPVTCDAGTVWCKKAGVYGCNAVADCDDCGVGRVWGFKTGVEGCWDNSEVDTNRPDGGTGKVYGRKGGTDGCHQASELDSCGTGLVYCYKDGVLGCHAPEDCDASFGGGSITCPSGTTCCTNKTTGVKGCWSSSQCSGGGGGDGDPDGPPDNDDDWDNEPIADCTKSDGTMVKCKGIETCCEKGGVRGCWPWDQCDKPKDMCFSKDCSKTPTDECFAARFNEAYGTLAGTLNNCGCDEICSKEFDKFGTTQGFHDNSYKPVMDIVTEEYGFGLGTPEFWEKYEEIKQEALDACMAQCDACRSVTAITLSGSETVTKPGGYQYTAEGGGFQLTWTISGTGATINQSGYVTLSSEACGSYTVTVTDECGYNDSMGVRITNAGSWVQTGTENCGARHIPPKCYIISLGDDVPQINGTTMYSNYGYILGCCRPHQFIPYSDNCGEFLIDSGEGYLAGYCSPAWGDPPGWDKYMTAISRRVYQWRCS